MENNTIINETQAQEIINKVMKAEYAENKAQKYYDKALESIEYGSYSEAKKQLSYAYHITTDMTLKIAAGALLELIKSDPDKAGALVYDVTYGGLLQDIMCS